MLIARILSGIIELVINSQIFFSIFLSIYFTVLNGREWNWARGLNNKSHSFISTCYPVWKRRLFPLPLVLKWTFRFPCVFFSNDIFPRIVNIICVCCKIRKVQGIHTQNHTYHPEVLLINILVSLCFSPMCIVV